ncbi:ADP-ribosylglycohydrolase family protein [Amnibacterium kyonggiense]|uniref:ADP-ribosylglycohydrolase n=1 Tax=Amnibacterium kyonggiense TaxID=595671 RepID=A0A4R7FLM9_9MICO|nr:ADP-ribosylglycohydrolase family protein [Amnibacterium kyonggiense]TDS77293.1 ADP-ribosylglycohydrolase [Amnibacterium kyonggiense]
MSSTTDDRAAGAVLGLAVGDALGRGGSGWGAATAAAVPVLTAVAAGESLTDESTQDRVVAAWADLVEDGEDLGAPTTAVLRSLREPTAAAARGAARIVTGADDGGALLRTAPVALGFLPSPTASGLARSAARIAALTQPDPEVGEACALWSAAIHLAVRAGELDLRGGLGVLPEDRRAIWSARVDAAEAGDEPEHGAVGLLQAAWSVVRSTPVPDERPGAHLRAALEAAAPLGPSVAALAGSLLGARWGASAVPAAWRRALHGWPGLSAEDLTRAAVLAANGGLGDGTGWPAVDRVRPVGPGVLVPHPHDDGVLLGSLAALDDLPPDVDAVVALCRIGRRQTDRERVAFWLVDQPGRNPNLDLVLQDAVDTIAALRAEGRRVLVHGAEGRSRTPAVGALYAAVHRGVAPSRALEDVAAALPDAAPAPFLEEAVLRIGEAFAAEPPKRLLLVDLDTAVIDLASGVRRLPASAQVGRPDETPGIIGLADPLPGAIAGFARLAEVYDARLLAPPPWPGSSAWQQRLDWVALHFGALEADDAGRPNPAHRRLVLADRAVLPRDALLVDGGQDGRGAQDADGFPGERVRLGDPAVADWAALVDHLVAPERTGRRASATAPARSRDRTAGRPALTAWLLESLRVHAGSASPVQVARDVQRLHGDELRRAGDLEVTWQHDLRRIAAHLREEGRLAPSADGLWRLAR